MARNFKRDRKGRFARVAGSGAKVKSKAKKINGKRKARKTRLYGSKDRSKNTARQNQNRKIRNINRAGTAVRLGTAAALGGAILYAETNKLNVRATRQNSSNFRNAQARGLKSGPIVGSKVRGGAYNITSAKRPKRGYR